MTTPVEVLDFWLGEVGPEGWYSGAESLDDECRDRFGDLVQAASAEGLDHWVHGPAGALAFLVLTDQLPRNIYRGSAEAFKADPLARAAARKAIAEGWDMDVPEPDRQFFYLPFEHSEELADQELAVELIAERLPSMPESLLHARAHRDIIARFGRFPFRNVALGRESTPAEAEFLSQGGYAAAVEALKEADGAAQVDMRA